MDPSITNTPPSTPTNVDAFIEISETAKTLYSSMKTGGQTSDFSNGPWTFVRLFTDKTLPKDFDLDRALRDSGITIDMVPHIVEHKDLKSYELVVATPCVDLLSERSHDFKIVVDYDPLEPAEHDIRIHGIWEANRRARINTLNNAAEATRLSWGHGPAECYRRAIRKAGLETELERAILNWDIQHSEPGILEFFAGNLLILCLNFCARYDSICTLDILTRDPDEWLQPFRNGHTDLSELLMDANYPNGGRQRLERQTISLFRSLLEFSGGKVDCRQHDFGIDYTASQNAALCASFLGVLYSRQFGRFDPEEMQGVLSKSKLFAGLSKPDLPDTAEWSRQMMVSVPVGFPDNYMNLPSQLLCGFGARKIDQIRFQFEHAYHRLPSLRKEENNILLLLTWSSTYHGQTLEVLSDWIRSEESLKLYQRLIEDLWLQQAPEEFALTLAALLCRERLCLYTVDDTAQPIGNCDLVDFDAILNGQDVSNRRTVFEELILSLVRVLCSLNTHEETVQLLVEVLDKQAPLLGSLDGVSDQYCARKVRGHDHNSAFEEVREGLFKSVEAMLERDRNAGADWTVIPR